MDEFFRYTLKNGIRTLFKRTESEVAYCAMTINCGSRDELESEIGMAHFVEHMLFKGTNKRRNHHINSRLENLGGELNAFTTKEETVVHATVMRKDLQKAVELVSDVLFNSVFPENEIQREKEVVLDEINSYKDSPMERIYDEFEDLVLAGTSLGHNILGTRRSVANFTREQLTQFIKRCYTTDQMIFTVCGNISQKQFIAIVERYFGAIEPSKREFERRESSPTENFTVEKNRDTHQVHCIIGCRSYDLHHPKRRVLALLTNVLGGPAANSRLNVLLREKNGLTYNIEASYSPYLKDGVSTIYFGTEKEKVFKCSKLIGKAIKELQDSELTEKQLCTSKKQIIGQMTISLENMEWYMLSAAKSYLAYGEIDTVEETYDKIAAISAKEIREVANEVFAKTSSLIYN